MFKSIKTIFLAISIALLTVNSANAALISHDILFDDLTTDDVVFEKIGYFVVDTDKADDWGFINSWEEFQIDMFGASFNFLTEAEADVIDPFLFGYFEAIINPDNVYAGLEAIGFDVTESTSSNIHFNGSFDFFAGNSGILDMFDANDDILGVGNIRLSNVTHVPEPSMLLLFLTGLVALRLKKRKA
jgi:hypothetical protein